MKLPADNTKYSARFRYVEVARYIPEKNRVSRLQIDGVPLLLDVEDLERFRTKFDNFGLYTSIYQYDSTDLTTASSLGSLCFDLDSNDLETSRTEAIRLVDYLSGYIPDDALRVYFSGGKGFHIECEAIALNISTSDELSGIYRFIAGSITEMLGLTSTDLVVYDKRRMWRLFNSQHQRTGLYKVECLQLLRDSSDIESILEYARHPREMSIPEQVFNPSANRWFREFVAQYEQSLLDRPSNIDLLNRFLEQGIGNIRTFSDDDKVFDKYKLFKGCSAAKFLVEKAYTAHHLDHYERLFLCSLLTYTPDAIQFLHEVLGQCSDYNPDITNAHIEDWIRRREYEIGGRPFTCDKAKSVGIICGSCEGMEPKLKIAKLSDGKYIETGEYSQPSPVRHCYTVVKGN